MNFNPHQLNPKIKKYVESIFHYSHFVPDHSIERLVPTGHIFLLFELDGFVRHTYDNESLEPNGTYQHVWLSGMHENFISISAHENSEMLVVQFKADGAFPFIHTPIHQFNEVIVAAEDVFGDDILQLRKQLLRIETAAEKLIMVEAWLLKRFDETMTPPDELSVVTKKIRTESMSKHQEIIDSYPYTQKHLIDQFKQYIGLTPKYYHRILRFNDLLQQIHQQESISWSDVANQCGYSDQSHFIKEFRHFSGFNPTEFLAKEFQNDETNFFPLDR